MKISKQNLKDISQLIFDGYLSSDVFLENTYITIRTLKTYEREKLFTKYKHLSKSQNLFIIIELLSISIKSIGGIEFNDKEKFYQTLLKTPSFFIMFMYRHYNKIEDKIDSLIKIIDFYVESTESKYYWNLFKNTQRTVDFNMIRQLNQFQYYWIVLSSFRETLETEKREWSKIEYMTNSICAFTNPKAYRRVKGRMNISETLNPEYESKLDFRNRVLARLERSGKEEISVHESEMIGENVVSQDQKVFDQLRRKEEETKEEYADRINEMMKEQIKGKVTDEHDEQVRLYEVNLFKKLLIEKRVKVEVAKKIREQRKFSQTEDLNQMIGQDEILKEEITVIGDDKDLEELDIQVKEKGYYHNGVSYLEIVNERAFSSIPKEEKEKAFKIIMEAEIDIEKATETFLKNLYKDDTKNNEKAKVVIDQTDNIDVGLKEEDTLESCEVKNAAEVASKMDIVINSGKDLVTEKKVQNKKKLERYHNALDRRNSFLKNRKSSEDLDEMFFDESK